MQARRDMREHTELRLAHVKPASHGWWHMGSTQGGAPRFWHDHTECQEQRSVVVPKPPQPTSWSRSVMRAGHGQLTQNDHIPCVSKLAQTAKLCNAELSLANILWWPHLHTTFYAYCTEYGNDIVQGRHQMVSTLGPMLALLTSSTCLHPLKRASMTRVLVTSFSLKNRFTRP